MRIFLLGATGSIGSALLPVLSPAATTLWRSRVPCHFPAGLVEWCWRGSRDGGLVIQVRTTAYPVSPQWCPGADALTKGSQCCQLRPQQGKIPRGHSQTSSFCHVSGSVPGHEAEVLIHARRRPEFQSFGTHARHSDQPPPPSTRFPSTRDR